MGAMRDYRDGDIVRTILAAWHAERAKGISQNRVERKRQARRLNRKLNRELREKFPDMSKKQLERCFNLAAADPEDAATAATDAAVSKAVLKALKRSGAKNLLELLQRGGPEADDLAAEVEDIHKPRVSVH